MVIIPFTPPHVSVNRVRIVDLPGLPVDAEVCGQAAYHLLSNEAVVRYALEQADALGNPPSWLKDSPETHRSVPSIVDAALSSPDSVVRSAGEAVAERLGRNLAHILLALHRGDACNRAARPDWTDTDWEQWAGIQRVWMGGGVMRGLLGRRLIGQATALLEAWGYADDLQVRLTRYPGEMSLLGAGRYAPDSAETALCFDFGQTMVKRGLLRLEAGATPELDVLTPQPTDWVFRNVPTAAARYSGEEVLAFVADVLARTLVETGVRDVDVMLSVAAYVKAGQLLGNGIYARMSALGDDLRPLLADAVRARCEAAIRVHLIHDGTAAAALHAGDPRAAVIVVGTALGVGFCSSDASGLRPLCVRNNGRDD